MDHTGFAPAHVCAFPVYTAQAPGCSEGELSKVGPGLHALSMSKMLRFRVLSTPQRHRLGWACVLCPSQFWGAIFIRISLWHYLWHKWYLSFYNYLLDFWVKNSSVSAEEICLEKYRRRQWHPTPVLLPGKSHGRRSLVGCSPWGHFQSDTTERLHFHFSLSCIGEGNGNPLQCSCLENPRDGGAWWAAVCGVAQSRTRLKWLSSSSSSL